MKPSLVIYQLKRLIYLTIFLKTENKNVVVGPRKREAGIFVPTKFPAGKKPLRVGTAFSKEILKQKNKHSYFELSFGESKMVK